MPAREEYEEEIALPPGVDLALLEQLEAYARTHVLTGTGLTPEGYIDVAALRSDGARVTADCVADLPALDPGAEWREVVLQVSRDRTGLTFRLSAWLEEVDDEGLASHASVTGRDRREVFGTAEDLRRKVTVWTVGRPSPPTPRASRRRVRRWLPGVVKATDHTVLGNIVSWVLIGILTAVGLGLLAGLAWVVAQLR